MSQADASAIQSKASPSADAPPHIEVRNLIRAFDGRRVLDGVNFKVRRGETLVILGGSGCGKSTLLRHIIGSLKPDSGEIWMMGREITKMPEKDFLEIRKKFGMLFQGSALLNSLTVGENVALPLQEHTGLAPEIIEIMVKMKTSMVGLTGFEHLTPSQISGGMKKRVALARAIAMDPEILFCDEPTAGLDPVMTAVVDVLINDLCKKLGMTAVVVTHDMASVYRIADHIVMLNKGRVIFEGTSDEIKASQDTFVKQFINGEADGPISFKQSGDDYLKSILSES
jgi:phospholipid/cholesterol/gamma-HCH transport system ATP-binding protein